MVKSALNALLWDSEASLYIDNETSTLHPQDGNVWAVLANVTESSAQALAISTELQARWGIYGAPAPEAPGSTVSPFVSGLECQAHILAGEPSRALDLMRLQWGYMLNSPLMTNSTFVEGYSTDGSLVYSAYKDNSRISHAHGWSTAPTFLLTNYIAGLQIESDAGSRWRIEPKIGNLRNVSAGFSTVLGPFSITTAADGSGNILSSQFCVPDATSGTIILPQNGRLTGPGGQVIKIIGTVPTSSLQGGCWQFFPSKPCSDRNS